MNKLKDILKDLTEAKTEEGHRKFTTHAGWKRAVKKIKPDAEFYGDKDIGGAKGIGEWDGVEGIIHHKKEDSKKDVKEGIISEISQKLLLSYAKKADDSVNSLSRKTVVGGTAEEKKTFYDKNDKKIDNRLNSMEKALKKIKTKSVTKESETIEATKLTEERSTINLEILRQIKNLPVVAKLVDVHYLPDGATALMRTTDGNAYEITIKQAGAGNEFPERTKLSQYNTRKKKRSDKIRDNWSKLPEE